MPPEAKVDTRADVVRRIRLNHAVLVQLEVTTARLKEELLEEFELERLQRAEKQQHLLLRRHNREPAV